MDTQASYKVDEIVMANERDALAVLDAMKRCIKRYTVATVGDYYNLVGVPSTFSDEKWGWTDFDNVSAISNRGWTLNLPAPKPLI